MNAFIDVSGILVSWGYAESNNDDTLVEVPDDFAMTPGAAKYVDGVWQVYSPPIDYTADNTATRDALLTQASVAIAPLQMAVSLGEATDAETASAKAWVAYSRAVKAIDLAQASPVWPAQPTA
jgi:hypothetical protein